MERMDSRALLTAAALGAAVGALIGLLVFITLVSIVASAKDGAL